MLSEATKMLSEAIRVLSEAKRVLQKAVKVLIKDRRGFSRRDIVASVPVSCSSRKDVNSHGGKTTL